MPYLDVSAMADRLVELMGDGALSRSLGRTGAERVRREFSVEVCAPRLMAVIERVLASPEVREPLSADLAAS